MRWSATEKSGCVFTGGLLIAVLFSLLVGISEARRQRQPKPQPTPTPPSVTTQPEQGQNPPPPAGYKLPPNSSGFSKDTVEIATPPKGNPWAIPWAEAIVDTRIAGPGAVQMAYLRLWARDAAGNTWLVCDSEYTQVPAVGALFVRVPWYGGNGVPIGGTSWQINPTPAGATIPITDPTVVYHWWNSNGRDNFAGATKIWAETCVKISGSAAFDFGWDYWSAANGGNDREGASSRFYRASDCPDWTILTLGGP